MSRVSRHSIWLAAWFLAAAVKAAAPTPQPVTFQGTPYLVVASTLPSSVTLNNSDIMIVTNADGTASIFIPTDGSVRTMYDPSNQHFYKVIPASGTIEGYSSLNSVQISLNLADGTLGTTVTTHTQSAKLETYTMPSDVPLPATGDIAVIDDQTMIYRDGETAIYTFDRSVVAGEVADPIDISDLTTSGTVSVEYDPNNDTALTVQQGAVDSSGNAVQDTLGAYDDTGSPTDLGIVLPNNPAFPGYAGGASGLALEPNTETFALLDSASQQVYVFVSQVPALDTVTPGSGPYQGGTTVTLEGTSFPSDAQVFFGTVQATVKSVTATKIVVAAPPALAAGAVDVTVTDAALANSPLVLYGGYTYTDPLPTVKLTATPTFGMPPLLVTFDWTGTADTNSKIQSVVLDFGDGTNNSDIPADLSVTTFQHTYSAEKTYTATLTVTDVLGTAGSASVQITASNGIEGVLVLRSLAMTIQNSSSGGKRAATDAIVAKGTLTLPVGFTPDLLAGGTVQLLVGPLTLSGDPSFGLPTQTMNGKTMVQMKNARFSIQLVKTRSAAPNTYAFTYAYTNTASDPPMAAALPVNTVKVGNLKRGTMPLALRFVINNNGGTNTIPAILFDKLQNPAVILIKTNGKGVQTVTRE